MEWFRLDCYKGKDMTYPAILLAYLLDCRTCRHFTTASGGCRSLVKCVDASMYVRAGAVRIWEAT